MAEAVTTQTVEIEEPSETNELVERPPAPKTNCFLHLAKKNDDWYWAQPSWKRLLMHCIGFWSLVCWVFAVLYFIAQHWLPGIVYCIVAVGLAAFEMWAVENRAAIEAKCGGKFKFRAAILSCELLVMALAILWPWFI